MCIGMSLEPKSAKTGQKYFLDHSSVLYYPIQVLRTFQNLYRLHVCVCKRNEGT